MLSEIAAIVQEEVRKIPELRKRLSILNLGLFSTDLALVAHGIRTGYLVDVIAPKDPPKTFSQLLAALGANTATQELFSNVLHIYEPTSDQSFFVNTVRLVSRVAILSKFPSSCSNADNYPAFVQLRSPITLLERSPKSLLHLLSNSFIPQPSSSLSFTLPAHVSLETVVPLAAVLLDYAVAYVPSAGYENVLSGIPLDFYECILAYHKAGGQEAAHTVMKFSCPAGLAQLEGGLTGSEKIVQDLQTMFAERLLSSGDGTMVVTVVHTVQSLNHVAF